jgi:GDP-L-fucose synthase
MQHKDVMKKRISKTSKIYVAGHHGMVGNSLMRCLKTAGYTNLLTSSRAELDLVNQAATQNFLKKHKPDFVFLAAAKVGGIQANNVYRGEFLYQNLMIELNTIHSAWLSGVTRLLFLGSSCIYPRNCPQPIKEEYLLTGPLEPTNEPYALAKIAGVKLCENYNRQYDTHYISVMPTNLYGPNDYYDLNNSHVLPALIRKAHEAKVNKENTLVIWGSGLPLREFLYVDDLAEACVFLMESEMHEGTFNVGSGAELSIRELAELVARIVGFNGELVFDSSKPDGTPRKLVEVNKLHQMGWRAQTSLYEGIIQTYADFLHRQEQLSNA